MQFTRDRYQHGSFRRIKRKKGPDVWEFRYRDKAQTGQPQRQLTLSTAKHPTEAQARRAIGGMLLRINSEHRLSAMADSTFGGLIDRFVEEERLIFLSKQKPGQADEDGLQYGTACAYLSILNSRVEPKWGSIPLAKMRPAPVQDWLKQIDAAPKYKAKIKALMRSLFEKGMLWELIALQRNPMELVEIRGISKRRKKPFVLTVEQYYAVLDQLPEPYRTMVVGAQCTGLRVSEILALKWEDIDFESLAMRVTRKAVNGRVSRVKTEYSEDDLPLDPDFATEPLKWQQQCPSSAVGWVFPSPFTGKPYYASEVQKGYIKAAGWKIGLSQNGQKVNLGWHSFRHTYRSLLDAAGAPVGVQQKLMRHAQVSTTMDVYGNAQMESKREANSKVVQSLIRAGQTRSHLEQKERGCANSPLILPQPGLPGDSVGFCGVESL